MWPGWHGTLPTIFSHACHAVPPTANAEQRSACATGVARIAPGTSSPPNAAIIAFLITGLPASARSPVRPKDLSGGCSSDSAPPRWVDRPGRPRLVRKQCRIAVRGPCCCRDPRRCRRGQREQPARRKVLQRRLLLPLPRSRRQRWLYESCCYLSIFASERARERPPREGWTNLLQISRSTVGRSSASWCRPAAACW